jgi:hypothetical protein
MHQRRDAGRRDANVFRPAAGTSAADRISCFSIGRI